MNALIRSISLALLLCASSVALAQKSTGSHVDDGWLHTKVKAAFGGNKLVNGFDVNVESNRGVVLLSGFVDSKDNAAAAIEVAQGVEGFTRVIDGTVLKPD